MSTTMLAQASLDDKSDFKPVAQASLDDKFDFKPVAQASLPVYIEVSSMFARGRVA